MPFVACLSLLLYNCIGFYTLLGLLIFVLFMYYITLYSFSLVFMLIVFYHRLELKYIYIIKNLI